MSGHGSATPDYTAQQAQINAQRDATIARINNLFSGGGAETTPAGAYGEFPTAGGHSVATAPMPTFSSGTGREPIYKYIEDAATAPAVDELNYNQAEAQRQNKFAMLRSGLDQSSTALEEADKTKRMYDAGVRAIQAGAVGAANTARTADESARLGIIQQVNAGTDANSAIQQGTASLQNNLNNALAQARGNIIQAGVFDPAALYYKQAATNQANLNAIPLYQKLMQQQQQLLPGGVTSSPYAGSKTS